MSGPSSTPDTVSQIVPRFEANRCANVFKLPAGQVEGQTVQCGYVVVLAEHNYKAGPTIKLAVVIFKSLNPHPAPEPILFLQGGPGGHSQYLINRMTGDFLKAFIANNDLVMFDQRGVGNSQPNLSCPELTEVIRKNAIDGTNTSGVALLNCHTRLVKAGNNLSNYNTYANANDVNDIRLALGYQQINLYGVSYGTLLAQNVMRQFPQTIRSVVLDGVASPATDFLTHSTASHSHALELLFKSCAEDTECNQTYPDLAQVFSDLVKQLNAKPLTISWQDLTNKQSYTMKFNGQKLVIYSELVLEVANGISGLPAALYALKNGDGNVWSDVISESMYTESVIDRGMYYSVVCSDVSPFTTPDKIKTAAEGTLPELNFYVLSASSLFNICKIWNVLKASPEQIQLLKSNLPTLILNGNFDPITPALYGQEVASQLSKSTIVIFPAGGHAQVTSGNKCAGNLMQNFFSDPAAPLDTSCVANQTLKFQINPTGHYLFQIQTSPSK
jgi:pimeloyl-ACP methyl ester carboxylesterase